MTAVTWSRRSSPPADLRVVLVLLVVALASGCGGAARSPGSAGPEGAPPEEAKRPPVPEVEIEPDSTRRPEPRRPWLPLGVSWAPRAPAEGEAVSVWLHQPVDGRRPEGLSGSLGGRPIHFARANGGWFGLGAVPIGASGPLELEVRARLAGDERGGDTTLVQRTSLPVEAKSYPSTELSVDPRYSSPSPEALVRIREERKLIRAALGQTTPRWLPEGPFRWPREGRITSPFGQRRVFNEELRSRHTGVDLSGETGAPVRASARGEVALTGDFYFSGNAVFLDHGLGVFTAYFHLSSVSVEEGATVEQGEVLGEVGSTGRVTGPHLHWALYVNGETLDARSLFRLRLPDAPVPASDGQR